MSSKLSPTFVAIVVALLNTLAPAARIRSPLFHDYENGHDDPYYDPFNLNRAPPCPRYQPLRVSTARDKQTFDISLPGVRKEDMDAWLSNDYSAIHVKGMRGMPSRGRACLPAEAKVSANGRHEILEAKIPIPAHADVQKVDMQEYAGAMRITIPQRARPKPSTVRNTGKPSVRNTGKPSTARNTGKPSTEDEYDKLFNSIVNGAGARKTAGARQTNKPTGGSQRAQSAPAPSLRTVSGWTHTPPPRLRDPVERPTVTLPPSTGLHIEDDEVEWPEESSDASAGWLDNRGAFQAY